MEELQKKSKTLILKSLSKLKKGSNSIILYFDNFSISLLRVIPGQKQFLLYKIKLDAYDDKQRIQK